MGGLSLVLLQNATKMKSGSEFSAASFFYIKSKVCKTFLHLTTPYCTFLYLGARYCSLLRFNASYCTYCITTYGILFCTVIFEIGRIQSIIQNRCISLVHSLQKPPKFYLEVCPVSTTLQETDKISVRYGCRKHPEIYVLENLSGKKLTELNNTPSDISRGQLKENKKMHTDQH